jgi:hypothetical protein
MYPPAPPPAPWRTPPDPPPPIINTETLPAPLGTVQVVEVVEFDGAVKETMHEVPECVTETPEVWFTV